MLNTLKHYSLDALLDYIANYSTKLFGSEPIEINSLTIMYGRIPVPFQFLITAWELTDLSYYAVTNTSDKRESRITLDNFRKIINEYKKYTNDRDEQMLESIKQELAPLYLIYSITQKQLWYQEPYICFEMFNRNYEMMIINSKQIGSNIDFENIVKKQIGMSIEKYINISILLFGIGINNVDITTILFEPTILNAFKVSEQDVRNYREYYSASYDEIRNSELNENILFTKPIVKTNSGKYIIANSFLLLKVLSDGLYWIVRNYYLTLGQQDFINEFGLYFEKYAENLFNNCLSKETFYNIDTSGTKKKADWILEIDDYIIIIEQKSMLPSLKIKQQYPDINSLLKYIEKYEEAFDQLNSTEDYIKTSKHRGKTIFKFVLHYDILYNAEFIKDHLVRKRNNQDDKNIYFINIGELERLIYLLKIDKSNLSKVLSEKVKREEQQVIQKSLEFNGIISDLFPGYNNPYVEEFKNHLYEYRDKLNKK